MNSLLVFGEVELQICKTTISNLKTPVILRGFLIHNGASFGPCYLFEWDLAKIVHNGVSFETPKASP